jgi:hypothetical protein
VGYRFISAREVSDGASLRFAPARGRIGRSNSHDLKASVSTNRQGLGLRRPLLRLPLLWLTPPYPLPYLTVVPLQGLQRYYGEVREGIGRGAGVRMVRKRRRNGPWWLWEEMAAVLCN